MAERSHVPQFAADNTVREGRQFLGLIAAAVITVVLWQLPGGNYALYPFTILATWFHEMAHGLMALILGGNFSKLLIFSNGSGVAYYSRPLALGGIGKVSVAAAGPMGPPIAGAVLIWTSHSLKAASLTLKLLGCVLLPDLIQIEMQWRLSSRILGLRDSRIFLIDRRPKGYASFNNYQAES